jgi:hypothetical protein
VKFGTYSPALFPSNTRAAPAIKRIWSIIGGTSSEYVMARGLPVFSISVSISSSIWASIASAMSLIAFWRTDGVEFFHDSKACAAACIASSTSPALESAASAYCLPVTGSMTAVVLPSRAATSLPLM